MIICIEGTDAAGKATQSKRLAERLTAQRIAFPTYNEHPKSLVGPVIDAHLKGRWRTSAAMGPDEFTHADGHLDALVFQALMTVNRYELAGQIDASVLRGQHVVLDRYWPSGYVYGSVDGLDKAWLLRIHECLPQPDLFILLDVTYETALARRPDRRDRYEKRGKDFFDVIRLAYLDLWTHSREQKEVAPRARWTVIDGEYDADTVTGLIKGVVDDYIGGFM